MSDLLITSTLTDATISVSDTDAAVVLMPDGIALIQGVTSLTPGVDEGRILGAADIIEYVTSGPIPYSDSVSSNYVTYPQSFTPLPAIDIPLYAKRVQIRYSGAPYEYSPTSVNKALQARLLVNGAVASVGEGTTCVLSGSGVSSTVAWSSQPPKISGTTIDQGDVVYFCMELNRQFDSPSLHKFSMRSFLFVEEYSGASNATVAVGYLTASDSGNDVASLQFSIGCYADPNTLGISGTMSIIVEN